MTEEKFTELVNLYLDKEISGEDLERMKAEILANPDRERAFVERCRLHRAMRLALEPDVRASGSGVFVPRWLLLSGMAASLALGFVFLAPINSSLTDSGGATTLVDAALERFSPATTEEELTPLRKSELQRYASVQEQRQVNPRASLVSQMRLMGLRPEHTPQDKKLERVDLAAIYEPVEKVHQAELFQRIQALKAFPSSDLIRIDNSNGADSLSAPKEINQPSISGFEEL